MVRPAAFLFPLALLFSFTLFLASCGGDGDEQGDSNKTPSANETPVRGGEVTVQHTEFSSLDPHFTAFGRDISQIGMIFRGLFRLNEDDRLVPELASKLPDISADGKTYTVTLKSGLKWSDGNDLTAADVVLGLQRTCSPDLAGQYSYSLFNIVGCQAYYSAEDKSASEKDTLLKALGVRQVSNTVVEIKLEQPQATFSVALALQYSWPAPSHLLTTPATEWPSDPTKLAFSGPFKVESFKADDSLVLVRNDNYGGPHLAYLDKVTLRYIDDLEVANNAYRSDEVMATQANVTTLSALRADPVLSKELVSPEKTGNTTGLALFAGKAPLDNQKLRLALSQATDRGALNKVLNEANIPTTSWIPEPLLGLPNDPFASTIGFDPAKAKQNFTAAGAQPGLKLTIKIVESPVFRTQAEFFKEQWKQHLGVELEIITLDRPSASKALVTGDYQVIIQGFSQDYPDPENYVDGLFNSEGTSNFWGCKSTKLDDLLEQSRTTLNTEARVKLFQEINKIISEEICGMAPLYHGRTFYLVKPELRGPAEYSTSQDRYLAGDWAIEEWYLAK